MRGKPKRANADVSQFIEAPRGRHSAKPDEVRERLVRLMGDVPRIELFAREAIPGWDVWGLEVESTIAVVKGKRVVRQGTFAGAQVHGSDA